MLKRRVVVTGAGVISPLGLTVADTWKKALAGESGIGLTQSFDTQGCPVLISGEVKDFDVTSAVGPFHPAPELVVQQAANSKEARKVGKFVHFALRAGLEAYGHSGLDRARSELDATRMGVNIGVGMGGLPEIEAVHRDYLAKGYKRVTPFFIPQVIPNMAAGQLSVLLNLKGPNLCNTTACTSSAHSIGESFRQIQNGTVDVMFAGGAESVICQLGIAGFAAMRALSTRNDRPQAASRPFDQDRDGFVMGEGAAVLVLEELSCAQKRGATIWGEILGYGLSGDAHHMTSPAPFGEGGRRAMAAALADAGLNPEEIGYINAHGTSTPVGDTEEAQAIARLFPRAADHLHISSTKSMTGHLLGAAGALEALFSLLAIRDHCIPPTINLDQLDPQCAQLGLNFTPQRCVEKKLRYALSNSFGFGGTNASLVLGQYLESASARDGQTAR